MWASRVQAKEWRGVGSSAESRQYTILPPSHWSRAGLTDQDVDGVDSRGRSRLEQDAGDGEAIMRPVDGCRAARHLRHGEGAALNVSGKKQKARDRVTPSGGEGTTAGRQWGAGLEIKEGRLARKLKKDSKNTKKTTKIAQANLPRYGSTQGSKGRRGLRD